MRTGLLSLIALIAHAQTPVWSLHEMSVPSTDSNLTAEFRSPTKKTILIHSFAEGANRILRVVPNEPGTWEYRLSNGQPGTFIALPSDAPGYVEAANVHHFRYTGSRQAHLWMGRAPNQPFTHQHIAADPVLDSQIVALHKAGITADLVVPPNANLPLLVARYGALNITWRADREAAATLKALDPYHHLIDYRAYTSRDGDAVAVDHPITLVPSVNDFGAGVTDTDRFRHALWRTTLDGAYPDSAPPNEAAAVQMKHWFDFFSGTRHWELEPFFDAGGLRAMSLEGVEYIVYVDRPGPVQVEVEKHSYEIAWFNPLTGETMEEKKNLKSETFLGDAPNALHDWVLHLSREGHKASMLKSYKFESREVLPQEVETQKVPFEIVQPMGETISLSKPGSFAAKVTKDTEATRAMRFVWTGEVTADGQPPQILGTGAQGQLNIPPGIAQRLPALLHVQVQGLNGVGKLYSLDRNYQLVP